MRTANLTFNRSLLASPALPVRVQLKKSALFKHAGMLKHSWRLASWRIHHCEVDCNVVIGRHNEQKRPSICCQLNRLIRGADEPLLGQWKAWLPPRSSGDAPVRTSAEALWRAVCPVRIHGLLCCGAHSSALLRFVVWLLFTDVSKERCLHP